MATGSARSHKGAAHVLFGGVAVSFVLLVAGLALRDGSGSTSHKLPPHDLSSLLPGLLQFDPASLLHAGILALILTPIVTTGTICVEFAIARRTVFALLTLGILLLLGVSLVTGMR